MEEEKKNTEEVSKPKKGGNILFSIFACLMTAVIVVLSINIGQNAAKIVSPDTEKSKSEKKCETTSNDESNKNDVAEITLSATEKRVIKEKFINLFSHNVSDLEKDNYVSVSSLGSGETYWTRIFNGKLTDNDRTYIVLASMRPDTKYDFSTAKFKDSSLIETLKTAENGATTTEAYEKSSFVYKYKNLFGVEPKYLDVNGCPGYYYDSKNETYVSVGMCGGVSSTGINVYMDSYIKTENSIIVSAYVGSFEDKAETAVTYKDYTASTDNIYNNKEKVDITEENKTSFIKNNFVFEKSNDGEYYFKNVTKAE